MKNLPTAAYVCLATCFVAVVAAFAYLSATGSEGAEFRSFLNTIVNLVTLLATGGALTYASKAQQQTNGHLDQRIKDAVTSALDRQRLEDTGVAVPLRDEGELRSTPAKP